MRWAKRAVWLALGLLLASAAMANNGTTPSKTKKGSGAALSPDEQAAQDLIERLKLERRVKREQERFLAEQHLKAGKLEFESGAWRQALRHFQECLRLDPTNKEAADYLVRARGLAGVEPRRSRLFDDYLRQRSVVIEMRKLEVASDFATAKALYEQGRYDEALALFRTIRLRAQDLLPYAASPALAERAEGYIQKCRSALAEQRGKRDRARARRGALRPGAGPL